ncbi:hypothetical protein [Spongiactinospora sp. TRM90649]|uniref:divisome protein SepX/GlpR n=1 Tax=Spongiactinospora sp. TRM90649 TaxID=3031114 RepID=UPI0023F9DFD5|nr:hypothetical protein [Spongiactinospora sp. TRM90649]MDF5757626.1 hypothetical protein [Spongiactinospora sp. TRM90649]
MSSALLYVAIVLMWLGVLIPMWLRRDRSELVEPRELGLSDGTPGANDLTAPVPTATIAAVEEAAHDAAEGAQEVGQDAPEGTEASDAPEAPDSPDSSADPQRRAAMRRRAVVVATRRRRLFWCTLLVLASVITAAVRVIPWWGVAPSALLMVGYLAVLRTAVRVDRERTRQAAEARTNRARRERERLRALELAAQQQPQAEIIDLTAHQQDELFDQYADPPRRAVGH